MTAGVATACVEAFELELEVALLPWSSVLTSTCLLQPANNIVAAAMASIRIFVFDRFVIIWFSPLVQLIVRLMTHSDIRLISVNHKAIALLLLVRLTP